MDFLKDKWREITTVLVMILIAVLLFSLINFLLQKRESVVLNNEISERKYNEIKSGEMSEEVLKVFVKTLKICSVFTWLQTQNFDVIWISIVS